MSDIYKDTFNDTFNNNRSKLIGLAYRMTGSRSDAEDIVNEAFVKWLYADHSQIKQPQAWLAKVTTRLALDHLKSAKVQRETYIGPWLPEPFIEDNEIPDNQHQLDQSLSLALLVLFETLSPAERAAYILHDLFNYSFDEVAGILNKTSPACRKLASRARTKIQQEVPQQAPHSKEAMKIGSAFFNAIRQGEMASLESMLKDNVEFHSDSDGKAAAAREILYGRKAVGRFLMKVLHPLFKNEEQHNIELKSIWFNGVPGFVIWQDQQPISAFSFMSEDGQIGKVYVHRNPSKLSFFV